MDRAATLPKVVIIGGGFGGLYAALSLRRAPVEVTLIDRRNFHLFQPLLYQVATGGLSPANIAAPLRSILKRQPNTRVILGEVTGFNVEGKQVLLGDSAILYDTLIVAAGSQHHYFGHDNWAEQAPGLKTVEDATRMRARILKAFESAEIEPDPQRVRAWLTFVIVGGGPTGAELAGALAEIAHDTLRRDFRRINPADAQILLVEGTGRILPSFPPKLSLSAQRSLERLGVTVLTDTTVADVGPELVRLKSAQGEKEVSVRTILWAAGVQASPLGLQLARATGAETDRGGRVMVRPDLTLANHPEIFVIGDLGHGVGRDGQPLPGVAQVGIQQGRYAAQLISARLRGRTLAPFQYRNLGNMATIGRASAVADFGWLRLSGYPAWLLWLFIHILWLVEFDNRLLVMLQWSWNYLTRNRAARLITNSKN